MKLALMVFVVVLVGCGADPEMGEMGLQGLRGTQGMAGPTGAAGPSGSKGDEGPVGERGPMGVQGPAGKDAAGGGYRPRFWVSCSRSLDLTISDGTSGTDGIKETLLAYSWILFSNGDVEVSCVASAGPDDGSGNEYYPATITGSLHGSCVGDADYPPSPVGGAAGFWAFETIKPGGPQAQYHDDASHWLNGRVITFADNDCNAQQMDASGAWTDASLSDIF